MASSGYCHTEPLIGSPLRPTDPPPLIRADCVAAKYAEFHCEYRPEGATEEALVRSLAAHATRCEFAFAAASAVSREAIRRMNSGNGGLPDLLSDAADEDTQLAIAAAQTGTQTWDKSCLLHSRAFVRTLQLLRELQAERRESTLRARLPPGFADEAECEVYLAHRIAAGKVACPDCGQCGGYYFPLRRSWECKSCKRQHGLRTGTVAASSQLPLWSWFEAIRWLLWLPTLANAELAERVGLVRDKTVRRMATRIRAALASEQASDLLAGLDCHFGRPLVHLSQAPVNLRSRSQTHNVYSEDVASSKP